LICVDVVKCQVKFCLLLSFLHIYLSLTNLASNGGPHEIIRRAACGPRVGQLCIKQLECTNIAMVIITLDCMLLRVFNLRFGYHCSLYV